MFKPTFQSCNVGNDKGFPHRQKGEEEFRGFDLIFYLKILPLPFFFKHTLRVKETFTVNVKAIGVKIIFCTKYIPKPFLTHI